MPVMKLLDDSRYLSVQLPKGMPASEFSEPFITGMITSSAVSYHKYGPASDAFPSKVSALGDWSDPQASIPEVNGGCLGLCLKAFHDTGDVQYLRDAANYLMFEAMYPAHPNACYNPTKGSAKRQWLPDPDGYAEISQRANDGTPFSG